MSNYSLHGYNLDGSDAGITLTAVGPLSQDVLDHLAQATPMTAVPLDIAPVIQGDVSALTASGPITPEMLANIQQSLSALDAGTVITPEMLAKIAPGLSLTAVGPITPEMLAHVVFGVATPVEGVTPIVIGDASTLASTEMTPEQLANLHLNDFLQVESAGPITPEMLANVVPGEATALQGVEIHFVGVQGHTTAASM